MINLLTGPPGGGKSYEAVVYHVLPAIEAGRMVITNLSLNLDELCKIEPRARVLVKIINRQGSVSEGPGSWAFGRVEDYATEWRHPETNIGPLFVVDEFHKCAPRIVLPQHRAELQALEEFFAEHRHTGADILFMTQSYGKVSKAITDQIQVCYRVKKATVFGNSDGYIRKVQDGVRGEVLSTAERVYEPKWFPLYKSHTRVVGSVIEADARDVSPSYIKWKRSSWAVIGLGLLWLVGVAVNKLTGDETAEPVGAASARTQEHAAGRPEGYTPSAAPNAPKPSAEPVQRGKPLRLVGVVQAGSVAYALTYSPDEGERRWPLDLCSREAIEGWTCRLAGQLVTANSGEAPPSSSGGGLADRIIGPG